MTTETNLESNVVSHTPTPYTITAMNQDCVEVTGNNGNVVLYCELKGTDEKIRLTEHATARFIVKACNAHHELTRWAGIAANLLRESAANIYDKRDGQFMADWEAAFQNNHGNIAATSFAAYKQLSNILAKLEE